jgi:hypothetical protein
MITRGSCGSNNDLGRVFCVQCGGKLDLSAMTSEAVAEQVRVSFMRKHWPKFAIGAGVLILAIFGMTFWPTSPVPTAEGTSVGARRVEAQLKAMAALAKGRTVAYEFKEADINAYFQYGSGKDMNLGKVSVKCMPEYMIVHVTTKMFEQKLFGMVLAPGTSYDLYCSGVGGNLIVRKAKKGHLGLIGPARTGAVRKFYSKIAAKNGFDAFKYATEIKIEEGRVRVTVSNK